jgi:hypothetical protein
MIAKETNFGPAVIQKERESLHDNIEPAIPRFEKQVARIEDHRRLWPT